tara:strand:- start:3042 stop:4472 length:1431 start_codon:yes stop_codon:yes gene_type:complete
MAVSIIEQSPSVLTLPVGQDIIFVISNDTAVANESKVKFGVEIHVSNSTPPNVSTANDLLGTFKTTPNNAGVGIFDLRSVIENYVKPDNIASKYSEYKGSATTDNIKFPLHIIDKFSLNDNTVRYMALQFFVEYLGATDSAGNQDDNVVRRQVGTSVNSDLYTLFNGYLKHTDELIFGSGFNPAGFGYDITKFRLTDASKSFLTNTPTTLYANNIDYGTLSFLMDVSISLLLAYNIRFDYYDSDNNFLSGETIDINTANGAYDVWSANAKNLIVHVGCYPANLLGWSSTFRTLLTAPTPVKYYTIKAAGLSARTQTYTININCTNTKGYESIRLCWLNQWGVWDYYTFTQKSVRSTTTQGSTYTQLEGTWNQSKYRLDSFRGGKKAFRVNAMEKITMNTDFVTEADAVIFEELINSPEVYLLKGYQTDEARSVLNQYVTPVRLTTSSFTTKTIANNKLMQYTFEVEKSKTLRTQSV